MEKKELRIVFMGTPEFAVATLRAIVEGGYNVVAVVTQPDKPVGRHAVLTAPPVKMYALSVGLPVLQPQVLRDEKFVAEYAEYCPDVAVVVAYRLLPRAVWSLPRFGTFNVHASLLPQYRGAAPINWALIRGESVTGVTSFFLDDNVDTGRLIHQECCAIPPEADAGMLHDLLMPLAAALAVRTIDDILRYGSGVPTFPQAVVAPLFSAPKIYNSTCQVDWTLPAGTISNFIRGLSPAPGAWAQLALNGDNGGMTTVKLYRAAAVDDPCTAAPGTVVVSRKRLLVATGDGFLRLDEVQLAGKRRLPAEAIINGLRC